MQSLALLVLMTFAVDADGLCGCAHCQQQALPARTISTKTTESFTVRSYSGSVDAAEFGRHAEAMRKSLSTLWLKSEDGAPGTANWTPRCEVVIHAQRASYQKAIGGTGAATSGSTLVRVNQGKVILRRIDLLADRPSRPFETISHELVHAIFAERFPNASPPRWAEEGAALLADTQVKRAAHQRDFRQAVRSGTAFRVHELVRMSDYPPPTRFAAFYGQSLVLVDFLTQLGDPGDFVRFVDRSLERGQDEALKQVYGIASTQQLQDLWDERAVKAVLAAN
jgi:hypothetical protein